MLYEATGILDTSSLHGAACVQVELTSGGSAHGPLYNFNTMHNSGGIFYFNDNAQRLSSDLYIVRSTFIIYCPAAILAVIVYMTVILTFNHAPQWRSSIPSCRLQRLIMLPRTGTQVYVRHAVLLLIIFRAVHRTS